MAAFSPEPNGQARFVTNASYRGRKVRSVGLLMLFIGGIRSLGMAFRISITDHPNAEQGLGFILGMSVLISGAIVYLAGRVTRRYYGL